MLQQRLKNDFVICLVACFFFIAALPAFADTKKVLIAFDRNQLCCIMNHLRLEEMLTDIEGIEKAVYNEQKREITVSYDEAIIKVATIIDELVNITKVEKEIIFLPNKK